MKLSLPASAFAAIVSTSTTTTAKLINIGSLRNFQEHAGGLRRLNAFNESELSEVWWAWMTCRGVVDDLIAYYNPDCAPQVGVPEGWWFLAGGKSEIDNRTCTIEKDKKILLPVINSFCAFDPEIECDDKEAADCLEDPEAECGLVGDTAACCETNSCKTYFSLDFCSDAVDAAVVEVAKVDSKTVDVVRLSQYESETESFDWYVCNDPSKTIPPQFLFDGLWLVIEPLSSGEEHVIEVKGKFPTTGFETEVTHFITVECNNVFCALALLPVIGWLFKLIFDFFGLL